MFSLRPAPPGFLPRPVTTASDKTRRPHHSLLHSALSALATVGSRESQHCHYNHHNLCFTAPGAKRGHCVYAYPCVIRGREVSLMSLVLPCFRSRCWPAAHEEQSGAGEPISAQNNKAWCWSTWAPARPERCSFAWRERDWPPRCLGIGAVNQTMMGGVYQSIRVNTK